MKIAFISYYYPRQATSIGVAIHSYYLSLNLAKIGHEIHVFANSDENKKEKREVGDGKLIIHWIKTESKSNIRLREQEFSIRSAHKILNLHRKEEFDIIHNNCWLTLGPFILKKLVGISWTHLFHGVEKEKLIKMENEKEMAEVAEKVESCSSYADKTFAVSKKVADDVEKNFGIKPKVILNGVDYKLFENEEKGEKIILFVGRLSEEKGIRTIIKLVPEILEKNEDTRIILLCPGEKLKEEKKKLENLDKKYGRLIYYDEEKDREFVADLFSSASIFLLPSLYEGLPLSILEALASGTPVISSNLKGVREVIDDGETGFLIEPRNKNKFKEKINFLLRNEEIRREMGEKAKESGKERDWKKVAEKFEKEFQKIQND